MNHIDFIMNNYNISKGVIKNKSNNHKRDAQQVYKAWMETFPDEPISLNKFVSELQEALDSSKDEPKEREGVCFDSVDELIQFTLDKHNIRIENNGSRFYDESNDDMELKVVETFIMIENHSNDERSRFDDKENKRKTFSRDNVKDVVEGMLNMKYIKHKQSIRKSINHDKTCEVMTNFFLEQICIAYEFSEDVEFCVTVMKHMIWQAKRYFYGFDVQIPYLLNIFGKGQLIGKSKLIELMGSPMDTYALDVTVKQILEPQAMNMLTKYYWIKLDEIQLPDDPTSPDYSLMQSAIKKLLTAKELSARAMHSERIRKSRRVYTATSSSNTSILKMMAGDTGLRRFIELETKLKPDAVKIRAVVQNVVDAPWFDIWKGIDENNADGYLNTSCDPKIWNRLTEMHKTKEQRCMFSEFIPWFVENNDNDFVSIDEFTDVKSVDYVSMTISDIKKSYCCFVEEVYGKEKLKFVGSIENVKIKLIANGYKINDSVALYKQSVYLKKVD